MARTKEELVMNATRWMKLAKRERIKEDGIGCMFVFFNLDDPTGDSAVCVASVDKENIKRHCEGILKKLGGGSLIINPYAGG